MIKYLMILFGVIGSVGCGSLPGYHVDYPLLSVCETVGRASDEQINISVARNDNIAGFKYSFERNVSEIYSVKIYLTIDDLNEQVRTLIFKKIHLKGINSVSYIYKYYFDCDYYCYIFLDKDKKVIGGVTT